MNDSGSIIVDANASVETLNWILSQSGSLFYLIPNQGIYTGGGCQNFSVNIHLTEEDHQSIYEAVALLYENGTTSLQPIYTEDGVEMEKIKNIIKALGDLLLLQPNPV